MSNSPCYDCPKKPCGKMNCPKWREWFEAEEEKPILDPKKKYQFNEFSFNKIKIDED